MQVKLKVRVRGRHPWFYRKMIQRPQQRIPAGSAVSVVDRDGKPVGTGFYNPRTDLALRMLDRRPIDDPDAELRERLDEAIAWRHDVLRLPDVTTGYRLVHSEGDRFPGIVIDRLGDAIVAQVFSLCMMQRAETIGEHLLERFPGSQMMLTVDDIAAEREGIDDPPRARPFSCDVVEHGVEYSVRPGQDHKTGFFADQREHRAHVRTLARGRRVLDLCCNSGGFALNAAKGGAKRVVAVDLDEAMVAQASDNAKRNRAKLDVEHGDAFDVLREAGDGKFDLIVLDPPKWIRGKEEVEKGERRYRDLNELAFRKIARGGLIVTCSCSGALHESRFVTLLSEAAAAAGRDARILHLGGAAACHPVALECQQTRYLKVATLGC